MAKQPKFRKDGEPDGRGHAEASKATQFAQDDGRKRPGRSKGSRSLKSAYLAAAMLPVTYTRDGKTQRISTPHAIALKTRERALKGDHKATVHFEAKLAEYSPIEVQPELTPMLLEEDRLILEQARNRLLGPTPPLPDADDNAPEVSDE